MSWAGGLLLVMYGGVNTVISGAVLAGVIRPAEGRNGGIEILGPPPFARQIKT